MAEIEFDNLAEMQAASETATAQQTPAADSVAQTPAAAGTEAADEADRLGGGVQLKPSFVNDDEEGGELTAESVRHLFDSLPSRILGQWKMLLIILAGIILYITSGYQAQTEIMEETALEAELKDWRYRSITRVSELTLLCRQSLLQDMLRQQGDTTLLPSPTAPYIIGTEK